MVTRCNRHKKKLSVHKPKYNNSLEHKNEETFIPKEQNTTQSNDLLHTHKIKKPTYKRLAFSKIKFTQQLLLQGHNQLAQLKPEVHCRHDGSHTLKYEDSRHYELQSEGQAH